MIRTIEDKITAKEFNYLTSSVGWGTRKTGVIEEALNNTLYSVSIYDDEKLVDYGRIIGDKTIFLYIQDVMVIPEYQNKQIGASEGKQGFYEKFGFQTRLNAGLGEGMVLF